MNHGFICYESDHIGSRLWRFCMNRGEFPSIYTCDVGGECFRESYTHRVDSCSHLGLEYIRFEPQYDRPFLDICAYVYGRDFPTVIVPTTSTDANAIQLVLAFAEISTHYMRRFLDTSKRKRRPAWLRIHDLIQPVPIATDWAYLIGGIERLNVTIFVASERLTIDQFENGEISSDRWDINERW